MDGDLQALSELARPIVHAIRYGEHAVDNCDSTTHVVSNRFLTEAYKRLFDDHTKSHFVERFYYVGGYNVIGPESRRVVWDHLIPVAFSEQSAVGVAVDIASGARALARLREMGLFLVGHIHSHPGVGREANHPSPTDKNFVRTLAKGRSIAVGAIFSQSTSSNQAFVRFFADPSIGQFEIDIPGNGVIRLDDFLFQIEAADLPMANQVIHHIADCR
jgi:hypothetical protein